MFKFLTAVTLFLMSSSLLAATREMEAATTASETVDMIWVVLFGVVFLGSIIGFFVYLWHIERNRKGEE